MRDELTSLVKRPAADKRLAPVGAPSAIRAKTGRAGGAGAGSGGGISSPLVEASAADRVYHEGVYTTTTDGLFSWPAIKTIKVVDADGRAVEIHFAAPA